MDNEPSRCKGRMGADAGGDVGYERGQRTDGDGQQKPQSTPTTSPTATAGLASLARHTTALQRLDEEYAALLSSEKTLEEYLHRLQQEGATLKLALEQSSTSLKQQREREAQRKDAEAVARLEEALMMGAAESDDDEDDDGSAA